ncbi:acyl-CoA dehydrogenase family protein [Actinomadura atramentaria]|uniref:acyl-CoA dehydrogenase family protein n=1 Tax=Actinomadura atramentaria TaxID=1990 RepID=UPI00036209E1|nr:acyl-CoA dehydrogenase family protein [Actinomadura atramentaria]
MARGSLSVPGVPNVVEEICHGRLPWDLVHPFPAQAGADRAAGDAAVAGVRAALAGLPDEPDGETVAEALRAGGWLHLLAPAEVGGRELSPYNAFRVITEASGEALPAGFMLAIHNGIGAAAYLPVLPDGPIRELVMKRLAAGAVTGMADTEPAGAANRRRFTTATADADGYVLDGDKLYIGNGPIAELLAVTATEDGRPRVFFVDTASPGFEVRARLEFMGLRGFPNGALALRGVRVPRELVLAEQGGQWLSAERAAVLSRGRVHIIAAPALALARRALEHTGEYVRRRSVDGRALGTYDEIQRAVAESAADLYALDATARWTMLGDQGPDPVNLMPEQFAAKDITSLLCWRIVERAMTVMAGEGYETARGKAARGAPPAPLERLYRDARGLRIAGGTEVLLQGRLADRIALACLEPDEIDARAHVPDVPELTARNREHLARLAGQIGTFSQHCADVLRNHPDPAERAGLGRPLTLLGAILEELVTVTLTLARAAGDAPDAQDLADVYCTGAWRSLDAHWSGLVDALAGAGPDHARISAAWLGPVT